MVDNGNRIQIYKYKDTNLFNTYYDLVKDEFCVKKNEQFKSIKWKNILRKYKNKKDDDDKQKTYHYIQFNNPETKQSKRITEAQWQRDKEVIKYNKEEGERQAILEEIWKHILKYIANYKTTIPLFNFDGTPYNPDNEPARINLDQPPTVEPNPDN
jgi:vancomycin resistance protein YoaR